MNPLLNTNDIQTIYEISENAIDFLNYYFKKNHYNALNKNLSSHSISLKNQKTILTKEELQDKIYGIIFGYFS